jgi:hypothetical protein
MNDDPSHPREDLTARAAQDRVQGPRADAALMAAAAALEEAARRHDARHAAWDATAGPEADWPPELHASLEAYLAAGTVLAATPALTAAGLARKLRLLAEIFDDVEPAWFADCLRGAAEDARRLAEGR